MVLCCGGDDGGGELRRLTIVARRAGSKGFPAWAAASTSGMWTTDIKWWFRDDFQRKVREQVLLKMHL